MDQLHLFKTLIAAIDGGSLSAAAKARGISQPAASQQITLLESQLRKELLFRTSRGVLPTEAGRLVYQSAKTIIEQLNILEEDLGNLDNSLSGKLRITAPLAIGQKLVAPIVFDMQAKYPDLDITLKLNDLLMDLVKDRFDLAIRVGSLGKSEGVARKIGDLDLVLVSSPDFINTHGRPQTPADLAGLQMIRYREDTTKNLELIRQGSNYSAEVATSFIFDNTDVILNALYRGIGFTKFPRVLVRDQIVQGALEELLPDYQLPSKPVYLLYPSRQSLSRRAQVFIDQLLCIMAHTDGIIPARGNKWRAA
ncbi:LysR family transcriptional regulator [Kiloniella laminariae]|uniref:LysR family transcriptional regulator n=1 Tax=Kiloniella laminariae TaxID=454162 RepID=A0ABT4LJW9_9PROT|nr:LysR family transcriptional regulator [Kiloniella laminariae]MCZ4281398.1 LysR family transcriptional regulator [Kiloniella laminariae]